MIRGAVSGRLEASIPLRFRGPDGNEADVAALIDTGFTEATTLPMSIIVALGLIRQISGQARLADGSLRQFDIYSAEVSWDGTWRPVLVSVVGHETLLGMRLLEGHELRIQVVPGGAVRISPLP